MPTDHKLIALKRGFGKVTPICSCGWPKSDGMGYFDDNDMALDSWLRHKARVSLR